MVLFIIKFDGRQIVPNFHEKEYHWSIRHRIYQKSKIRKMIINSYYKFTLSNFKFINKIFFPTKIYLFYFFFNVRWSKIRLVYFIHIPLIEYPKTERLKSITNQKAWPTCHRWKRNDTWLISTDFNTSVKRFTCSTVIFLPTSPIVARYWKPSFILYNKDNHESNFFELHGSSMKFDAVPKRANFSRLYNLI